MALWEKLTALHLTDEFLARAVSQLRAAVQIPTETFDAMGLVGEDVRWETRGPFVEHLAKAFPLVYVCTIQFIPLKCDRWIQTRNTGSREG
jgi:Gly-Xaa carboxypeptidase